ncbi:hypothetical protein ACFFRR_009043 [Megaselia abdita]
MDYRKREENRSDGFLCGTNFEISYDTCMNISLGIPGNDTLHKVSKMVRTASQYCLNEEEMSGNCALFQYGPPAGPLSTRMELSKFLAEAYGGRVYSADIFLTNGASAGLHYILSSLLEFDGYIFVDEAVFMLAFGIIKQFSGLKIVSLKITSEGCDLEDFEKKLKNLKRSQPKSKMFSVAYYTSTVFNNPTGITFSKRICKGLIELSRKYDFLIISDDVYNIYTYKGPVAKRLFSYDEIEDEDYKGNVLSNGTFSKYIAPGMRIGWIEAPPRIKEAMTYCGLPESSGGLNQFTMAIVKGMLRLGLAQDHIKNVKEFLGERMKVAINTLNEHLPQGCSFNEPIGGFFIWITLPEGKSAKQLLPLAKEKYNVFYLCGDVFRASSESKFENCLRVSISYYPKEKIAIGLRSLCEAIREYVRM